MFDSATCRPKSGSDTTNPRCIGDLKIGGHYGESP